MHRPGTLAHDDQVDPTPDLRASLPDLLVLGGGRRAELEHLAQHRPGPPAARHRDQRRAARPAPSRGWRCTRR